MLEPPSNGLRIFQHGGLPVCICLLSLNVQAEPNEQQKLRCLQMRIEAANTGLHALLSDDKALSHSLDTLMRLDVRINAFNLCKVATAAHA